MNASVFHGYGAASPVRDSRSAEAAVLRRITGRMAIATSTDGTFPMLARALDDNRRFWKQAAIDLSSAGNGLPQDLRGSLMSLAAYIETQTSCVLTGKGSADALIDINSAVIRGLTGEAA